MGYDVVICGITSEVSGVHVAEQSTRGGDELKASDADAKAGACCSLAHLDLDFRVRFQTRTYVLCDLTPLRGLIESYMLHAPCSKQDCLNVAIRLRYQDTSIFVIGASSLSTQARHSNAISHERLHILMNVPLMP